MTHPLSDGTLLVTCENLVDKQYEIRDPIHGFVELSAWEWEIISQPVFQRLRRIRQLGLTDMVYPGATHTRFEHSLGVMHVATRMFDAIVVKDAKLLKSSEVGFNDAGIERDRHIVRLAALLHDCGHAPFSHASESVMPENPRTGKPYEHEDYSSAIVRILLKDVIENHPDNRNHEIKADDVAALISGEKTVSLGRRALWKHIISGQMDADRSDYLLRDSHHAGVAYGHYDLNRLISTLGIAQSPDSGTPLIGLYKSGLHTAEAIVIARYMMFTQVYFQKTRRIYDKHLQDALGQLLPNGTFPPPDTKESLQRYCDWDDWAVMGKLRDPGSEAGQKIILRNHDRMVFETRERLDAGEIARFDEAKRCLQDNHLSYFADQPNRATLWYKGDDNEIPIIERDGPNLHVGNLTEFSTAVKGLMSHQQLRLYVPQEQRERAAKLLPGRYSQQKRET